MDSAVHARGGVNESVALRLAHAFRRHGVDTVFGQSIPSAFFLAAPQAGIRQATYRAENAGGTMADGYARVSGKVGVVTAQNGPAATLLVAAHGWDTAGAQRAGLPAAFLARPGQALYALAPVPTYTAPTLEALAKQLVVL